MNRLIKIALIVAIAFISGCYYDTEERLYPKLSNPCDDINVTFSGTVTTILQPCLSCHSNATASSSGSGIKLENYADLVSYINNGKLMGAIRHDTKYVPMPQNGGKLPQCEIDQLQKWIDAQMPNN
jgi:hypothetical protein